MDIKRASYFIEVMLEDDKTNKNPSPDQLMVMVSIKN